MMMRDDDDQDDDDDAQRRRSTFGALDALLWRPMAIDRDDDDDDDASRRDDFDAVETLTTTTTTTTTLPLATTTTTTTTTAAAKATMTLPDSDDDSESEIDLDDACALVRAGAWSAYDASAAPTREDAIHALEARERAKACAKAAMEAKAKEMLNASGRPKRGAVREAEAKVKEGRKEAPREDVEARAAGGDAGTSARDGDGEDDDDDDDDDAGDGDCRAMSRATRAGGARDKENRASGAEAKRRRKGTKRPRADRALETTKTRTTKTKTSVARAPKVGEVTKPPAVKPSRAPPQGSSDEHKGRGAAWRVLLSSGFSERQKKTLSAKITRLGGRTTESLREFDVFVTEMPLLRTKNVMAASMLGKPIVSASWVETSAKTKAFAPFAAHVIRDKKFEAAHNFTPPDGSNNALSRNCFKGKSFSIWVHPERPAGPSALPEHLRDLLVVAGARPASAFAKADLAVVISAACEPSIDHVRVFPYGDVLEAFLTGVLCNNNART